MQNAQIPVACVQTRAHDREDFDAMWPHIVRLVDAAALHGARLIVLPEGTVPGYVLGTAPVSHEQLKHAALTLASIARQHGTTIVYGAAKILEGRTYNAALAVGPDGREIGHAAKQFLWHFDRRWFAPGETLEPVDTPAGRLGLLVCADGRIPTIAATLCERGAQVLVMPTAWVTSGRDPHAFENIQADLMANVRARENGVPFVVANKAGVERECVAYCGKSAIIDARGAFVARASECDEEIVYGSVDLSRAPMSQQNTLALPPQTQTQTQTRTQTERARIAFTSARLPNDVARFEALAAEADADVLLVAANGGRPAAPGIAVAVGAGAGDRVEESGPLRLGIVTSTALRSPRGLIAARLAGIDLFVWHAADDSQWHVPFARTRAAELRAYIVAFDAATERAFAVDPDGVVVAGTFGAYRMASFAYDRARAAATTVAPTTDVFAGLRNAEAIRARVPSSVP